MKMIFGVIMSAWPEYALSGFDSVADVEAVDVYSQIIAELCRGATIMNIELGAEASGEDYKLPLCTTL
jgi:hypothetical protein